MTHEAKRLYMIRYLLDEGGYRQDIPEDADRQRQLLRGLMNVRPARPIDDDFLAIQDEYLREALIERGAVDADDLTPIEGGICVWRVV